MRSLKDSVLKPRAVQGWYVDKKTGLCTVSSPFAMEMMTRTDEISLSPRQTNCESPSWYRGQQKPKLASALADPWSQIHFWRKATYINRGDFKWIGC